MRPGQPIASDFWDLLDKDTRYIVLKGALLMADGKLCGTYEKQTRTSPQKRDIGAETVEEPRDRLRALWRAADAAREARDAKVLRPSKAFERK